MNTLRGTTAFALLLVLGVCFLSIPVVGVKAADWPRFRYDLRHTGVSPETLSVPLALLWSYPLANPYVFTSPAISDGVTYFGSYTDYNVYAVNATTGTYLWNYTTGDRVVSSPAVDSGVVFIGSRDGTVYALDGLSGARLWNYSTTPVGAIDSSPVVSDGIVFVGSGNGNLYALNASDGTLVWSYPITSPSVMGIDSSPALSGGLVYFGAGDAKVYAVNASSGAHVWNFTTGRYIEFASPAISNGMLFIGSTDSRVYGLNASTGAHVWNYTTGDRVDSSPAVASGVVFIGSNDHQVYALNATTGTRIWNYTTGSYVRSSPAISNGIVFVGSDDGKLYALNASNGAWLWEYQTAGIVFSSPAIADGVVYVGAGNTLYAFAHTYAVTIGTNGLPSGLYRTHVYVDGVDQNMPYVWDDEPRLFTFKEDTTYTIAVDPVVDVGAGTRYYCETDAWTTTSTGDQVHNFTYVTQYYLTIAMDPVGLTPPPDVVPPELWYTSDTVVECTAHNVTDYRFSHWTVDTVSQGEGANPIYVTMDAPHNATAYYVRPSVVGGTIIAVSPVMAALLFLGLVLLALPVIRIHTQRSHARQPPKSKL